MKFPRLLIVLFAAIAVAAVTAVGLTVTGSVPGSREATDPPSEATPPASSTVTAVSPSGATVLPPTTDLFGNRLEVPADEAGLPLAQDAAARPDPGRQDYLSAPPARLQWQRIWGGAAVPVSGSDGPTRIAEGIATGFAHTPQGAALAALDALARALAAPDGVWQQLVRERYYGGGQALVERFARSRERTGDPARYVVVPDGVRIQPGYDDDLAIVQVATRDDLGYTVATWPMAWIDGDWRIRVPDNLETLWGPGTSVATVNGFGSWKAGA
ncbi:hypothetical membrane protein [Nocardia farcinica]|uniref:hypothetical protein n=1 Tax=Nocardia farcinica TaxID=37329 RepID=UPI000E044A24|nr:hypothetical protein [Nocardia farcinica]SUE28921.1 hypothetical membrane protein [Nocardia farcinica]